MRRTAAVLAGLLAALALVFSWREGRSWAQERARAAAAEARHEELAARLRRAQQGLDGERRQRADLARARAAGGGNAAAESGAAAETKGIDPFARWLATRPDSRARYLQAYHDRLQSGWGLLFQALRLTPDQADGLKDLLTQLEGNWLTVEAAAASRGLSMDAPEIKALDDQLDNATKAEIKALVGQADYQQIHQYMHEEKVVPVVDQLAGQLVGAGAPLTPEQAVGLTAALADSSQRTSSGAVVRDTIDWDQAVNRAGAVLNATQLSVLSLVRDQNIAQQESRRLMKSIAPAAYR